MKTTLLLRRIIQGALIAMMMAAGLLAASPCVRSAPAKFVVPAYIDADSLWPPPNSEISIACFIKRNLASPVALFPVNYPVHVSVLTLPILDLEKAGQTDTQSYSPFSERVSLYMDNRNLKIDSISGEAGLGYGDGNVGEFFPELAARYTFGTAIFLWPGEHTARLEILTASGSTLRFEWKFKIK